MIFLGYLAAIFVVGKNVRDCFDGSPHSSTVASSDLLLPGAQVERTYVLVFYSFYPLLGTRPKFVYCFWWYPEHAP